MQEPQNGGRQEGTPDNEARSLFGGTQSGTTPGGTMGSGTMSAQDEKLWSMLSHLSVLVAPVGALIIWLIYKDQSPTVRFHALQALWYQIAWFVLLGVYTVISLVLMLIVIGFFMFFLLPVLGFIPLVHACYGAYKVNQGEDFRYPFIADWIDGGRRVV